MTEEQATLAQSLAPVLRDQCAGHLGPINWFKATWQHGGASTGFAEWTCKDGSVIDCVVKLPVGYTEYHWTKRLGLTACNDWHSSSAESIPTPRVLAAGFELGSYDFAWIVMEKFKGLPTSHTPTPQSVWELFETCAEFQAAAITLAPLEPDRTPSPPDWAALIDRGLKALEDNDIEHSRRWVAALHHTKDRLDDLTHEWDQREINSWCHHDLHGGNAMRRAARNGSNGRTVLIDLAMVQPGHWLEDALYLERLAWGHESELLQGIDPLATLAKARAFIGLPVGDDHERLATIRRTLMAASTPAYLRTEGSPAYLRAALRHLEHALQHAL
ncbi:MAG: phosphotransferase family protein [Phycisphaerales bacterium JB040]